MKLPTFLEIYKKIRKPAAPREKAHGKKGYSKAERRRLKREIDREREE